MTRTIATLQINNRLLNVERTGTLSSGQVQALRAFWGNVPSTISAQVRSAAKALGLTQADPELALGFLFTAMVVDADLSGKWDAFATAARWPAL